MRDTQRLGRMLGDVDPAESCSTSQLDQRPLSLTPWFRQPDTAPFDSDKELSRAMSSGAKSLHAVTTASVKALIKEPEEGNPLSLQCDTCGNSFKDVWA